MSEVNWEALETEITDILDDALDELADGARSDMLAYANDMAKNLVYAIKEERDDLVQELKGQARLLAEMNRIRLNRQARRALNRVLEVAARVGKALLAGLI